MVTSLENCTSRNAHVHIHVKSQKDKLVFWVKTKSLQKPTDFTKLKAKSCRQKDVELTTRIQIKILLVDTALHVSWRVECPTMLTDFLLLPSKGAQEQTPLSITLFESLREIHESNQISILPFLVIIILFRFNFSFTLQRRWLNFLLTLAVIWVWIQILQW